MRVFGKKIPVLLSAVIWLGLWELIGQLDVCIVIPPFSAVWRAGISIVPTAKFLHALAISLEAFGTGVGISLAAGIPIGILMGRSKTVDAVLGLWINIFVSSPKTALVPLFIVIFGIGRTTVVAIVVLFAVFVIILDTRAGIQRAASSLEQMARSFAASRLQLYQKVILRGALPEILTGLRLALIRGVKGFVVGQLFIAVIGMGELFDYYSARYRFPEFFAVLLVLFLLSFGSSGVVGFFERAIKHQRSVPNR